MVNKRTFFRIKFFENDSKHPSQPYLIIEGRHQGTYFEITPEITEPELDDYIDDMIKELESIRREGKRKLGAFGR